MRFVRNLGKSYQYKHFRIEKPSKYEYFKIEKFYKYKYFKTEEPHEYWYLTFKKFDKIYKANKVLDFWQLGSSIFKYTSKLIICLEYLLFKVEGNIMIHEYIIVCDGQYSYYGFFCNSMPSWGLFICFFFYFRFLFTLFSF